MYETLAVPVIYDCSHSYTLVLKKKKALQLHTEIRKKERLLPYHVLNMMINTG